VLIEGNLIQCSGFDYLATFEHPMPSMIKTPAIVPYIWRNCTWHLDRTQPTLFLSFDDGPIPEVTPWVLDLLAAHEVKATFFCVGKNIALYPELFLRILAEGHHVGNHTYHHVNGWKHATGNYINDVSATQALYPFKLFRPPYGKLRPAQLRQLLKLNYQVVMWDVLSYDWEKERLPENIFQDISKYAENGSILVFHDSLKAEKNLREVLPKVLLWMKTQGYEGKVIPY
jgi:peptidoglycan/xylan/chitin deacetylase (PgdA/CDA1 family)